MHKVKEWIKVTPRLNKPCEDNVITFRLRRSNHRDIIFHTEGICKILRIPAYFLEHVLVVPDALRPDILRYEIYAALDVHPLEIIGRAKPSLPLSVNIGFQVNKRSRINNFKGICSGINREKVRSLTPRKRGLQKLIVGRYRILLVFYCKSWILLLKYLYDLPVGRENPLVASLPVRKPQDNDLLRLRFLLYRLFRHGSSSLIFLAFGKGNTERKDQT